MGNRFTAGQVFGLKLFAIRSENKSGLLAGGGGAVLELAQRFQHIARWADCHMNVVVLKNRAFNIALVRVAVFQTLKGGCLVAKRFEKRIRKPSGIKGLFR